MGSFFAVSFGWVGFWVPKKAFLRSLSKWCFFFVREFFFILGLTNEVDPHRTSVHKKFVCFFAPSFCETPAETRIPHGYPRMTFRTLFFCFENNHHLFWGLSFRDAFAVLVASLTSCETPPCRWSTGPILRGMKVDANVAQLNCLGRFPDNTRLP